MKTARWTILVVGFALAPVIARALPSSWGVIAAIWIAAIAVTAWATLLRYENAKRRSAQVKPPG